MPLYIEQSGDLERCQRCLTHSQTTLKDSATQLLIKYKSGALVTQLMLTFTGNHFFILKVVKKSQRTTGYTSIRVISPSKASCSR